MSRTTTALVLSLLVLSALAALPTPATSADPGGVWYGEYFTNNQVRGEPAHTMHHHSLNFYWRDLSPPGTHITEKFLPGRNHSFEFFSARWTRTLVLPDAQTWRFEVMADDGVRIFVNGIRVLDHWYAPPGQPASAEIPLSRGSHNVRIEYFQNTGYAFAHISAYPVPGSNDPSPPPPRTLDIPAARSVAWAPDARTLAIAGDSLYLHHYYENRLVRLPVELPAAGHQPALAWHPDGHTLAAGLPDGRIIIHSLTDNQTLTLRDHTRAVSHIAFSPDGQTLATGGGETCRSASGPCDHYDTAVRLWNTQTWSKRGTLTHGGGAITTLTFTPDGKYVQAGSYDATAGRDLRGSSVLVWHHETGVLTKSWRVQAPVSFARDGRMALTGAIQNRVQLLNIWTGEATAVVPDDGYTWTVAASRFNHRIATAIYEDATRHGTRVRNHLTGADVLLVPFSGRIAISPGGRYLVTTEDSIDPRPDFAQPQNDRVRVWEISSGKMLAALSGHLADPRAVSADFSPGEHLLAVALPSGTVRIHNLARLINHPGTPPVIGSPTPVPTPTPPAVVVHTFGVRELPQRPTDRFILEWSVSGVTQLRLTRAGGYLNEVAQSWILPPAGTLTQTLVPEVSGWPIMYALTSPEVPGWRADYGFSAPCEYDWLPGFHFGPDNPAPGCPHAGLSSPALQQEFENGFMLWAENGILAGARHEGVMVYSVFEGRPSGIVADTWRPGTDPINNPTLIPPPGLYQPSGRFYQVWQEPAVREALGWAVSEQPYGCTINWQLSMFPRYPDEFISLCNGGLIRIGHPSPYWDVIYPRPSP